jgi:LysR family hydrogen peroxide-inducible transcriptional activator
MTLTELRYIVAVARERHFGKAAESCYVSQPTLSVAIKKLEEELEVVIFERGRGEVTLTPMGEQIVSQAQRVLEEASRIGHLAQQGQDQLAGPLRVGAIYTVGPYLFPHLIPALADAAPKMRLIVEENYTSILRERLKHGDLDVIIVSLPFDEPGILTMPLYEEPFVVLLPSSHPLTQASHVDPERLAAEQVLLLGAGHCFRDQVLDFCPDCYRSGKAQGELQQSLEGGSLETIRYMVASGLGVTVVPCTAAGADQFSQRLLTIRRFTNHSPARQVALAWRRTFTRPDAVKAIARSIADHLPSCVESSG